MLYGLAHITQSIFWDIQTVIKRIHSQLLDKTITKFLMEKISSLDAVYFEKPEYHTTLSKASDSIWRVNEFFWQVTFLFGQVVSSVVIIGALFSFKPIVVLLVIAGAMPSLIFAFKKTNIVWSAFDFYSPIRKEAHYYKRMMTDSPEAIKEIKLFGLRKHFLEKFDNLFTSFINKQKRAGSDRNRAFGFYGAYRRNICGIRRMAGRKIIYCRRNINWQRNILLGNIVPVCRSYKMDGSHDWRNK